MKTYTRFALLLSILFFSGQILAENFPDEEDFVSKKDSSITQFFQALASGEIGPLVSAHRGGKYYTNFPENSMEVFEHVLSEAPAIIECDIQVSRDDVLVLMHDQTLNRTTNGTGKVSYWNLEYLKALQLRDNDGNLTEARIPTLKEVLEWSKGKTILTLDVKRNVPLEKVINLMEQTETTDNALIIVYNLDDAVRIYNLNPNIMISVSIRNLASLEKLQKAGIPNNNMVAFVGTSEPNNSLYPVLEENEVASILGTLGNLDKKAMSKLNPEEVFVNFVKNGARILATDYPLECNKAISATWGASDKFTYFMQRYFSHSPWTLIVEPEVLEVEEAEFEIMPEGGGGN